MTFSIDIVMKKRKIHNGPVDTMEDIMGDKLPRTTSNNDMDGPMRAEDIAPSVQPRDSGKSELPRSVGKKPSRNEPCPEPNMPISKLGGAEISRDDR